MIVQILIESLPISSSGHVLLLERLYQRFGLSWPYDQIESINFLFHASAFAIMFYYFFNQWSIMIIGKKFELQDLIKISNYQKALFPLSFILIADLITFIFWKSGISQIEFIQQYFLPIGFFITAMMLYQTRNISNKNLNNKFSFSNAVIFGITQGLALLPGISRFGATFFVARFCKYDLKNSFAISFLIQFPLVCGALVYGYVQMQDNITIMTEIFNLPMLFGMVVMSFVSYKIFGWVGTMIEENKIWYFSCYMIIPIVLAMLV
jgi:undecaprenyl-diphosphatase